MSRHVAATESTRRHHGEPSGAAPAPAELTALQQVVQANCHIADARQAGELPLCVFLLQMREFYRWERALAFGAPIERRALGLWLAEREALWAEVEPREFAPLPIGGALVDAHDVAAVNAALRPHGLVYGAGWVGAARPTFFLARLDRAESLPDGLALQECGAELARGLIAPPAALVGGHTIVLRRESLARWLWEKFEAHSLHPASGPFQALLRLHAIDDAAAFVAALPWLVDALLPTLLLHERGEHRAAQRLEPEWAALRLALQRRRTELHVRAVRDHLADLGVTLPALIERDAADALHFWFANYDGVRESLYPTLKAGYADWAAGDGGRRLRAAAEWGARHFGALAEQVVALRRRLGDDAEAAIERLLTGPEAVCPAPPA